MRQSLKNPMNSKFFNDCRMEKCYLGILASGDIGSPTYFQHDPLAIEASPSVEGVRKRTAASEWILLARSRDNLVRHALACLHTIEHPSDTDFAVEIGLSPGAPAFSKRTLATGTGYFVACRAGASCQ